MKILLIVILISFIGCVSYNPNYMENKTTGERIIDVALILGYGAIIGATTYYYLEE